MIVADIRAEAAQTVAETLARGTALALDVTSSDAWAAAVQQVVEEHGRVDVLVNNAATHVQALVEEMTDEAWDHVVRTNTSSVFYGCRAVIPPMRAAGSGSIVNIVTGQFGVAYSSAYTSSKFLVHGFSQCLVLEVARYGIRVNCIAPGAIPDTGFERWYREKAELVGRPYDAFLDDARDAIPLRALRHARGDRRRSALPRVRRRQPTSTATCSRSTAASQATRSRFAPEER